LAQQIPLHFEFRANAKFEDFFSGSNQEIVSHLIDCGNGTGEPFIYLWGNAGQGKSHLLQACCHLAQAHKLQSFYYDCAIDNSTDPMILSGLDQVEMVCIDNIDCIAGDSVWEQALFNFFNFRLDFGHKLIVSASCSPGALAIQLPDLKTRLNWGLALKIKPLSDNDKIAALMLKAKRLGFELAPATGRFLLSRYDRNPELLWHLLEQLSVESLAAKRKLTIPFLKTILEKSES
jgi:DnaA-homolog protein